MELSYSRVSKMRLEYIRRKNECKKLKGEIQFLQLNSGITEYQELSIENSKMEILLEEK